MTGAKRGNKPSVLIGQWSKKLTDGQSNLLLSNQAHALDGAIFPWLCDTRAFLLLNHLEMFSCILLISNHMIFSKTPNCTCPMGSCNFVSLWKYLLVLIYSKLHSKSCDYLYKVFDWYISKGFASINLNANTLTLSIWSKVTFSPVDLFCV